MKRGNIRKFGREAILREAFIKSLTTALIDHGEIRTTVARAKTLARTVDKMVTVAKKQSLAARRQLAETLNPKSVKKLVDEIAPQFKERSGGYTQTVHLGQRRSDGAPMALIRFTR